MKNCKVFVLDLAKEDFEAGKEYYKQISAEGLSEKFKNAVRSKLMQISKHPSAYAVRYKNVRVAYTEKFPYAIHFFIDDNSVFVTAIVFDKRDPQIALSRV